MQKYIIMKTCNILASNTPNNYSEYPKNVFDVRSERSFDNVYDKIHCIQDVLVFSYTFGSVESEALTKTMPVLQLLQITGGKISLMSLDFPWNQKESPLPFGLRRSIAYDKLYSGDIPGIPADVHRWELTWTISIFYNSVLDRFIDNNIS